MNVTTPITSSELTRHSSQVGSITTLLQPVEINRQLRLKNRIVLAPCTRNRSEPDLSPTKDAIPHYVSRASAGLLITEGTIICREAQGSPGTPGIYTKQHVARWAEVTGAVHDAGGLIFCQLWHLGRMAHSFYSGTTALAPSSVLDAGKHRGDRYYDFDHEMPRAMTAQEVRDTIRQYGEAAKNAREAGFDGVEIHGANGYLPEQFLRQQTNRREDEWGGSAERRARFLVEVVDACAEHFGYERVGVRVSPAAYFSEMRFTPGDEDALIAVIEEMNKRPIAYMHTGVDEDDAYSYLRGTSTEFIRHHSRGILIGNGAYEPAAAAAHIEVGRFDLISFGRLFLANADLVHRLTHGVRLAQYSRHVFDTLGE